MTRLVRWVVVAALALVASSAAAAPAGSIEVQLTVPSPVLQGDVDVFVTVTVTNTARHPVNLLRWQLPSDEPEGALFRITRDGQPVTYTGPLYKRTAPGPEDHVRLDPGESLRFEVELTATYDLSANGAYQIEYASRGAHGAAAAPLRSEAISLRLEGRQVKRPPPPPPPPGPSITYTRCTATQQTALQAAVEGAVGYSDGAIGYFAAGSAGARYVKWFGAYQAARWTLAGTHFSNVKTAFTTEALTFSCQCKQKNVYAYVYPSRPYEIYLCGAFWPAPLTGTDSKAGTLIHEMTHFPAVAGTDDYAYGQAAAAQLALTNPDQAVDNADSHEYFAENNPPLP